MPQKLSAFTDEQLERLMPFVGEIPDTFTSHFMATWQMYSPFLTCEVKCGAAALDVADRQNAHSMTLAVRGVVELFRIVKREKELHREILAFFSLARSPDSENIRSLSCARRRKDDLLPLCDPYVRLHITKWQGKVNGIQIHHECLQYMDADSLEQNLFSYRRLAAGFQGLTAI
jgi:hypothetical protein